MVNKVIFIKKLSITTIQMEIGAVFKTIRTLFRNHKESKDGKGAKKLKPIPYVNIVNLVLKHLLVTLIPKREPQFR